MSYYPGCDDNDDSNERIALDAVIGYRGHYEAQLALLKADGDGYTVLGQFYPNLSIERLREMRGAELERICANLERLDADIARLSLADDDEFPDDVGGFDPDAVVEDAFVSGPCRSFIALDDAPVFCAACGYQNCDHAPADGDFVAVTRFIQRVVTMQPGRENTNVPVDDLRAVARELQRLYAVQVEHEAIEEAMTFFFGLDADDVGRGYWLPAEPSPILCATLVDAVREYVHLTR